MLYTIVNYKVLHSVPANTDHDAALCSMLFTGMWNIIFNLIAM